MDLTTITSTILPSPELHKFIDWYNARRIKVVPSTCEYDWKSVVLSYESRRGKKPYKSDTDDSIHFRALGVRPTYKCVAGQVLRPLTETATKLEQALLHFDELPLVDKLFLLNLNVWTAKFLTNGEPWFIDSKALLKRRKDSVDLSVNVTISRKHIHKLLGDQTTSKYLCPFRNFPREYEISSINYPHTAAITKISDYKDIWGAISSSPYINVLSKPSLNEYSSFLGNMSAIGTDNPDGDANANISSTDYDRIFRSSIASSSQDRYDDRMPSCSLITPIYDHALIGSRNVDLSHVYSYLHGVAYLIKSIQSLVNDIYAETLPEARMSNGESATLLDFFGKHNLFDARAAMFLRRIKDEHKENNHVTLWYNLCKVTRDLDKDLRVSGLKHGIGDLLGSSSIRDLMLFLVPEAETGVTEFMNAVESGKTGTLNVMTVKNVQATPGMLNQFNAYKVYILNDHHKDYIDVTTNFNPVAFSQCKLYRATHRPFTCTDGVELAVADIIKLNRVLNSSMILKNHESPFLKSLHNIFTSYTKMYEARGVINDLTDFDHVQHIIEDTEYFFEDPSMFDPRQFISLSEVGNNTALLEMSIPNSIHCILRPLVYPAIENDTLDFSRANIKMMPNNKVVLGILSQEDMILNYNFQKDAIPNIWPPSKYRHVAEYDSNQDVFMEDFSDIFEQFNFINSTSCKSGNYTLANTPYGVMYNANENYLSRPRPFACIANDKDSPSTIGIDRHINRSSNLQPEVVTITDENGVREEHVWKDRGINIMSALTYTDTPFIPLTLSYTADTPGLRNDNEYSTLLSRGNKGTELENRLVNEYLGYFAVNQRLRLIFSVDAETGESKVNMEARPLRYLYTKLIGLAPGIAAMGNVLTDYLMWRSELFPEDKRFLRRTIKLRNMCMKYGQTEYVQAILQDTISQLLNGDDLSVLKEV